MDGGPPGSSVHGILQPRMLEWAATASSRGSSLTEALNGCPFVSCIGRLVPYHWGHLGSPDNIKRKHLSESKRKCQPGLQQFNNTDSVSAPQMSHDHCLQHFG